MKFTFKSLGRLAALAVSLVAPSAWADTIQVTDASITAAGATINWVRTNIYVLNGYCYVKQGQTLNIEAGTIVKGVNGSPGTFGALFITRGARIYANGTPTLPIIFTADTDNIGTANPWPNLSSVNDTNRGLWGGIVLMGSAILNTPSNAGGAAASPKYDVFEGLNPDLNIGGQLVHQFGGNDDNDNSGVMRYVSIRHAGKVLESAKELNGLSLCAVGRGTVIEFIEAYMTKDDGFEFFGGTVNTRHLVSAFNDDDAFDADQGYRGQNQFWFGIQAPDVRDKGFELNGEPQGLAVNAAPIANFTVYNATMIGAGVGSGGANNNVFTIRDYAAPRFYNSIFTDFAQRGISIDVRSLEHLNSGLLDFRENLWFGFTAGNTVANLDILNSAILFNDTARSNVIADPLLTGISRTNNGALDPRPQAGSPALASSLTAPENGFLTTAAYKGAFDRNNLWFANWTALSQYGFAPQRAPANVVQVTDASITAAGTTINWYRTNIYVLNGYCYVKQGQTLNIEAGTIVKGVNGSPGTFGALFITRGARIYANGTPTLPIIFTADTDNIGTANPWPNLSSVNDTNRGLWGGIVLMGSAVLNTPSNAGGAAASPKYDVFEGLNPDLNIGGQLVHQFGGNDDNDNSGVMRYVSIRHAGKVLESAKELNALSLCAVGRGTVIEFIEAYMTKDDGFEFFGGTVNTRYLVSAFNDDDAFDTDQGYRGRNQFWFGIQAPDVRDKGFELNGEPQGLAVNAAPIANFEVYNATSIGAGVGSGGANNNVFTIRDYAAPKFFNSIFTDYAQRGVSIDVRSGLHLTNGILKFENNLWFGFTAGNTVANLNILGSDLLFNEVIRSNLIADPLLTGISRTNNRALDPRPQLASPARAGLAKAITVDGFLTPVSYVGAFGDANWAADWTALSDYGILSTAGGATPAPAPQATAPVITANPANTLSLQGGNITLAAEAFGAGPLAFQWFKDGFAIPGANSATLALNNVRGSRGGNFAGPSSTKPPYMESTVPGFAFQAIMSAGDFVNFKADGVTPHRLAGLLDGAGAYDNGDGTFTLLVNHEIRNDRGVTRAHGGIGAFVSKLVINKSDLRVLSVSDLATNVFIWSGSSFVQSNAAIARLCSADLPAVSAFFNATSSLGTTNRIFMNGEENANGRAFGFVATGPDTGKAYELPYLGKFAWENSVASPFAQDKTIVAGLDDDGTTDSQVYFYIGTKQASGLDIEKAGLQNGSLYGVQVTGLAAETDATTQVTRNFTLFNLSSLTNVANTSEQDLENLGNANGVTAFQRVEDGVWDPANPRDFYFVTTASFTGKSRLWRLRFTNIATPEAGGTIDMLLEGGEGQKMMDNIGISNDGRDLFIQEDPGGQTHNAKIWRYTIATGAFSVVAQHVPTFFTSGQPGFLTLDEESSGIIDVSHILGYRAFLLVDQIHSTNGLPAGVNTTELAENGQILLLREVDNGSYTLVVSNGFGSVTSAVANVSITAPPAIGQGILNQTLLGQSLGTGGTLLLSVPTNAVAGTGPFTYQWRLNGVAILGANAATFSLAGLNATNAGNYDVVIGNTAGSVTNAPVPVSLADIAFFGGITLDGPANARYRFEYLSDINNTNSWTTLTNIVHPGGRQFYIDTSSDGRQRRFFRAVPMP